MKKFLLLLIIFCYAEINYASNLSFMNYSPASYFSEQDSQMMQANVINALNNYGDGKKASWNNPKTGAFGYAIPSKTTRKNGYTCRSVNVYNNANNVGGDSNFRLCKINGEWKIYTND